MTKIFLASENVGSYFINREQRTGEQLKLLTLVLFLLIFFNGECPAPAPIPDKPTLTATVVSANQIDLTWTAVTNATKYNLFDGSTQIGGEITDTKYSHKNLDVNSTHNYTLKACNGDICSNASDVVSITTDVGAIAIEHPREGHRDRYGVFKLTALANANLYRIGVRKEGEAKPTPEEMEKGHHLKINLSTNPIYVLVANKLDDAPVIQWAKEGYDSLKTPVGLNIESYSKIRLFLKDVNLTGNNRWVENTLLAPSTRYRLYGKTEIGNSVFELATFFTDAVFLDSDAGKTKESNGTADSLFVDKSLSNLTLTINKNNIFNIVPMQFILDDNYGDYHSHNLIVESKTQSHYDGNIKGTIRNYVLSNIDVASFVRVMSKLIIGLVVVWFMHYEQEVKSLLKDELGVLRVRVMGIEDIQGVLRVGIYRTRKDFETDEWFKGVNVYVKRKVEVAVFDSVVAGSYAVKVFQDVNGNGVLDKNFLGIPTEPFAFSNNAKGFMGPPDYNDCIFLLDKKDKEITIKF
ncbi:hypothetical protein CHS0354_000668 [Potamilus streckersoni]|uniref:Fibronectin type-III domain-containing protein n=1 Tax=Potamilus streckersoni TaxID=2493646 RepID=A0AAE0T888_9BIVA|nr:hypothetical protein CHS0354_000668 [Potamilus streckersoni]